MRRTPAIVRSRFGPYFSSTTRLRPFSPSSTDQLAMYPSCWRISAMWVLILLYGITTRSWYAWLALRTRVSMSAIGSVIDIRVLPLPPQYPGGLTVLLGPFGAPTAFRAKRETSWGVYQEDLVMPGSSPAWAISRKQMRQRPNARNTARGRPQRLHRV